MNAVQIDQLPYLCLRKIFSFLELRDLSNCRAVNRLFKAYAEERTVGQLVVSDEGARCSDRDENWYQTDRPIQRQNSISRNAFVTMKSSPSELKQQMKQQLKFLHIHLEKPSASFDFRLLNTLKALVHLEIKLEIKRDKPVTLSLPNLKVLDVRFHGRLDSSFVLETPKLEVLACDQIERFKAEHPHTIKRLECTCPEASACMATFQSLQALICHCHWYADLNAIPLSNWQDLRELQIHFYRCAEIESEDFRGSLMNLMRESSKREALKVYLQDVLLTGQEQLDDYIGYSKSTPHLFRLQNYRSLRCDTYDHVTSMDFDDFKFIELYATLTSDFFVRFPRIQELIVNGPVGVVRFEWFLQNATAVRELRLTDTYLKQETMDRLPVLNSRLTRLMVYESSKVILNFDFVLQFERLQTFITDREVALDLAAKAFRQLNEFASVFFKAGDDLVEIGRCSTIKNDYSLRFFPFKRFKRFRTVPLPLWRLKWTELVTLCDKRAASVAEKATDLTAGSRKRRADSADDEQPAKIQRAESQ